MNIIKELEIMGFKSFVNKTKISFVQEITAVVGPNGCGKSNILDSIKWVLGEKSVKAIRGEKMEDVIFSGTENRKPANFAQVNITFNNETRIFDTDSHEIKIGRRVYRDGQSHYFINEKKITRREVETLLMDTGIGKSSYSFMEQGKMDMILSSKPDERRLLFEEAAGISRFKSQKEAAEKDLYNTELNITRLNDILHELKRELDIKKEQAVKTEVYNKLLDKQKNFDLRIRYITLKEMRKRSSELSQKLERKQQQKEKINQKVLQTKEKIEILENKKTVNLETLHEKDINNKINREKIEHWEKSIETGKQKHIELEKRKKEQQLQIQKIEKSIQSLKKDLDQQLQFTLEIDSQITNTEKSFSEISNEIIEIKKNIDENLEAISKATNEQNQTKIDLQQLRFDQKKIIQDLLDSLKIEKDNFSKVEEQKKSKINILVEEITSFFESDSNQKLPLEKLKLTINYIKWVKQIRTSAEIGKGLRHLLFEKGGTHSQKEVIDEKINTAEKLIHNLEIEKNSLIEKVEMLKETSIIKLQQKEVITGDIKRFKLQKENFIEKEKSLLAQIKNEESSLAYFSKEYNNLEANLLSLLEEQKLISKEIEKLRSGIQKELNQIESLEKERKSLDEKKVGYLQLIESEGEKLDKIQQETNELELKLGTYIGSQEALIQEIYNEYNLTVQEVEEKLGSSRVMLNAEKVKLNEVRKEIEKLGLINPLAIEEMKSVEGLHNHNKTQLDDIIEAKKNILDVIEEVQKKSEKLFLDSFNQIVQNFKMVFQKLFEGGHVDLILQDPQNPLTSGIEIQVQPPGKRPRSLRLLSGGEKALTAISLMFAIYLVRSAPFCILDEIDAPLDDQNVNRFLKILDDFKENTQFILITHNKKSMSKADAIFGVTMEEPGESKILGVNLKSA